MKLNKRFANSGVVTAAYTLSKSLTDTEALPDGWSPVGKAAAITTTITGALTNRSLTLM